MAHPASTNRDDHPSPQLARLPNGSTGRRPPSPFAAPDTPIDVDSARVIARRVMSLARRMRHADRLAKGGWAFVVRSAVLAPARAALDALGSVRKYGAATVSDAGVPRTRQFASAWWLNFRHYYTSAGVYRYRLFTPERRSPVPLFMHGEHAMILFRAAALAGDLSAVETLADKRRFEAWCAAQGISTPPILMAFEGGRLTLDNTPGGTLPAADLFAKWGARYGGSATERWTFERGSYLGTDGRRWPAEEIVASLAARSREGLVLLQPRLVNHPALVRLSPNALSTIRVMTTKRPGGPPRFLASVLRMGTGQSTADNFAQGGIASAIDAETGVTGPARSVDKHHRTHVYDVHPDTGVPTAGLEVPFWREAVELAVDAHRRLGEVPCIGWDVAVTSDGVVLLEGNWNPCVKLLQVATQTPLYTTEFASCFAAWLDGPMRTVDDGVLAAHKEWYPV